MIGKKKIKIEDISIVVLVGGLGTRIKHINPNKPKPLINIKNKPFLHWIIREIDNLNFKDIFYATGYKGDQIENWVNKNEFKNINQHIINEKKKLGTAGSLFNLIDSCKKNIIVLNGDSFLVGGIESLLKSIKPDVSCALVCHYTKNTSRFGAVVFNKDNQLTSFSEKEKTGSGYINSGIYYFSKERIIKYKSNGYMSLEYELIPNMIENNEKIEVIKVENPSFIDIGTERSINEISKIAKKIFIE